MIVFLLFGLALLTLAQAIALHRFVQAAGAVLALLYLQLRAAHCPPSSPGPSCPSPSAVVPLAG